MRKKILSFLFLFCFISNQAEIQANEISIGIALGFTGPTESIVPSMASSAELAILEANSSKIFLSGEEKINLIQINTMCDKSKIKSVNKKINEINIIAIIGAACPGISEGILWDRLMKKTFL